MCAQQKWRKPENENELQFRIEDENYFAQSFLIMNLSFYRLVCVRLFWICALILH